MTRPKVHICQVPVAQILPLRHKILRAGMPLESAHFDGDHAATSLHLAAFEPVSPEHSEMKLVACLSLMLNSLNNEPAWQLRGMAVDESHQRGGLGRKLLASAEQIVADEGKAGWLWCNARVPAAGFYQKQGWAILSDVFDIPTAGPHVKMSKKLNQAKLRETVEKARAKR